MNFKVPELLSHSYKVTLRSSGMSKLAGGLYSLQKNTISLEQSILLFNFVQIRLVRSQAKQLSKFLMENL